MSGRSRLTTSMLMGSGAFDGESEEDDHIEDVGNFLEHSGDDDDEEAEVLLYSADESASAQSLVAQAFASHGFAPAAMPSVEDVSSSIADDMARLNIGPPQLDAYPMSIVVQFWHDDDGEDPEFIFEVKEMDVAQSTLEKFCTQLCLAPYRARTKIEPELDGSDARSDDSATSSGGGEKEEEEDDVNAVMMENTGGASTQADTAAAEVVVDDVPDTWIPARGRVNVLAVLYTEAPVIVGLLTEHYDVRVSRPLDDSVEPEPFDVDRMNAEGKRVRWLDSAIGSGKRARIDGDGGDPAMRDGMCESDAPHSILTGMHDFAESGNHEWTSATNRDALVCAFERDSVSGNLKEVRVALALDTIVLRRSLQEMLLETRNNL